jgi:hypothetical protein
MRSTSGEEMEQTRRSSSALIYLQGLGQSVKYRGSNQSVFGADDADLVLEWELHKQILCTIECALLAYCRDHAPSQLFYYHPALILRDFALCLVDSIIYRPWSNDVG